MILVAEEEAGSRVSSHGPPSSARRHNSPMATVYEFIYPLHKLVVICERCAF